MSKLKKSLIFLLVLVIIYCLGPSRPVPILDNQPLGINSLNINTIEEHVTRLEAGIDNIKPNNEAEIVWANDTNKVQTEYAFVYLPGFGATKGEGEPTHRQIARYYGMNLYLARLEKQGLIEEEPFIDLQERKLVESAKEAVRVAKILGKKVIILSCSTGSTLGLYLAAQDPSIAAVVAYSPNIDLADPTSMILTKPWGLQIARLAMQSKYRGFEADETVKKWWTNYYRIEGLVALKSLVQHTMKDKLFPKIKQPVLMAYYYKNDTEKDNIVSIDRMHEVFDLLATPIEQKRIVALGEVSGHCMASQYYSTPEQLKIVFDHTIAFLDETLHLAKVIETSEEQTFPEPLEQR